MPISDVSKGIFSKYTGSALASVLTGGLHEDEAPQDASFPYCVYEFISDLNVDTFTEHREFAHIQFSIWTNDKNKRTTSTGLDALVSALRTLYDGTVLTVSGWTNLNLRWISERSAYSEDTTIIGAIIEYETYISKSK